MIELPNAKDSILERHTGVTRVILRGNPRIAEAYLKRAQVYMGWLRHNLALAGIGHGVRRVSLENGVIIRTLFDGAMNTIEIYAPPVSISEGVFSEPRYPLFSYLPHDVDNYGFVATESGSIPRPTAFIPASVTRDSIEESFTHLYVGEHSAEAKHRLSLFTGNQTFGDDEVGWFSYWGSPHGDLPLQSDADNLDNGYYMPYARAFVGHEYSIWIKALDGVEYPVHTGHLYHNKKLLCVLPNLMIVGGGVVSDLSGGKHVLFITNNGTLYEVIKTADVTADTPLNEIVVSRGTLRQRHSFYNMFSISSFVERTFNVGGVDYTVPAEKHSVANYWGGWEWRLSETECALIYYPINESFSQDPPDRIRVVRYQFNKTQSGVTAGGIVPGSYKFEYYLTMTGTSDTLSARSIVNSYNGGFSGGTFINRSDAISSTQAYIDTALATVDSDGDSVNTSYTRTGEYPIALNYVDGSLVHAMVTHNESGTFIGTTQIARTVDVGPIIVAKRREFEDAWLADVAYYLYYESNAQTYSVVDNRSVTLTFGSTALSLVQGREEYYNNSGGAVDARPFPNNSVCLDPNPLFYEDICRDPAVFINTGFSTKRTTRELKEIWPQYLDLKTGTYTLLEKDFTWVYTDAVTTTNQSTPGWTQNLTTAETTRNRLKVRMGYATSVDTLYDSDESWSQSIVNTQDSGVTSFTNRTEFTVDSSKFIFKGGTFPPYWHTNVGSLHCAEITTFNENADTFYDLSLLSWYIALPKDLVLLRNASAIDVKQIKTNIPGFIQATPYGGGNRITLIGV